MSLHAHSDARSRTTIPIILISFIFLFLFQEIIAATPWVVAVLLVHSLPVFLALIHAVVGCKYIGEYLNSLLSRSFDVNG